MSRTAAEITTRVGLLLKDTGATNYSAAELYEYINEAVRRITREVAARWPQFWLNSAQAYKAVSNIVATTANYDLPTDFYAMIMVTLTDSDGNVAEVEGIDLVRSLDSDADGYLLMNDDVYLYPTPDTSVTAGLNLYYIALPALVAAADTAVPLSQFFEDAIVEYVVVRCKARQGESVADEALFWKMVEETTGAQILKTNKLKDAGLRVPWRPFV